MNGTELFESILLEGPMEHPYLVIIAFFLFCIFGVMGLKIIRRGRQPKDGKTIYGCTDCQEYFSTPEKLQEHSQFTHNKILTGQEVNELVYTVNPEKYEQMVQEEEELAAVVVDVQKEENERVSAELSRPIETDPVSIVTESDAESPEEVYSKTMDHISKSKVNKELDGAFNIDIVGRDIVVNISATIPNTPENMSAIAEFNKSINS